MKTSTLSQPKAKTAPAILLIGPPGGGKTTLAMQFPKLGIVNCDDNLDGPEHFLRRNNRFSDYVYEDVRLKDDKPVPYELCAERVADILDEMKVTPTIGTIFLDGLTYVNDFCIARTINKQGKKETMERQDWIPFRQYMLRIVLRLRNIQKTVIMSCHEELILSGNPPTISSRRANISSKLTNYFGGYFTDIWRCYAEPQPGGRPPVFKLATQSTGIDDLKSSCGMPPLIDSPTFTEINKYLKLPV